AQVHMALRRGEITRTRFCEICGGDNKGHSLDAHHEDYSKPLKIKWLCRSCHRRLHPPGSASQPDRPSPKLKMATDDFKVNPDTTVASKVKHMNGDDKLGKEVSEKR